MSRILLILFLLVSSRQLLAQTIFKKGEHYGLRYEQVEYAAVFDEVIIKDYFAYGRMGSVYYNLNPSKKNTERTYRKFDFRFADRLLVIGQTIDGKIDIMNETGEHFYLLDGPYTKVIKNKRQSFYGNDDLLIVKKGFNKGVFNWTTGQEIISPEFGQLTMHESCEYGGVIIFAKKGMHNKLFDEKGNQVLHFKGSMVSDVYPSNICKGFIIQWKHKVGYLNRLPNGKYFLIKPIYDNIYFPHGDDRLIIVQNRDRSGLYHNYRRLLKCKYEEINLIDNPYQLAVVKKRGIKEVLMNNGELKPFYE